jgi:hypothetical protein
MEQWFSGAMVFPSVLARSGCKHAKFTRESRAFHDMDRLLDEFHEPFRRRRELFAGCG